MDTIKFVIDREKKEITFYFTEEQMKHWAKELVKRDIKIDVFTGNLTGLLQEVAMEVCKRVDLDFDDLKPKAEMI
jgi:hypothetical protein